MHNYTKKMNKDLCDKYEKLYNYCSIKKNSKNTNIVMHY